MADADESAALRPVALVLPAAAGPGALTVVRAASGVEDERRDGSDVQVHVAVPLPSPDLARIGFIGKRLGRFLISGELGRGGMATVYRARDEQIGRDVALKVMHGFFAGRPEVEARFRREANAVAAIRHPSILSLYEFAPPRGEEPGYIVSELIEGPGLRKLIEERGGRVWPEVAGLLAVRIAEALAAAHAAGIVHRDVKPDNVLIDRSSDRARVVLTDFGVAHVSGLDTMTATGAVLGSPAYMSPEQARGDDVGPPSDVFSLGVLIYQLITGHLPFSGKDPLTVITAILRGEYLRPSRLDARVGPTWEQVIVRCLAPDPAARFPDGAAVAVALRDALRSAGVDDEPAALDRYLAGPAAFERALAPEVARRALGAAEQARRQRQIPRALAEVGRALAYAPGDATAQDLLDRVGSRHHLRLLRGVVLGGAASALLAGAAVLSVMMGAGRPKSPSPAATVRGSATSVVPAAVSGGAAVALAPVAPPSIALARASGPFGASRPAGAKGVPEKPGRPGRASRSITSAHRQVAREGDGDKGSSLRAERAASPALVAGETAPGEPNPETTTTGAISVTVPATVPASTSSAAGAEPASGSVILRASHGFCEPSLDEHPPSLRANYRDLAPGPHRIFCTLPQGGGKVQVATYDLRPGRRPSLIIVPGSDGRPTLAHPE